MILPALPPSAFVASGQDISSVIAPKTWCQWAHWHTCIILMANSPSTPTPVSPSASPSSSILLNNYARPSSLSACMFMVWLLWTWSLHLEMLVRCPWHPHLSWNCLSQWLHVTGTGNPWLWLPISLSLLPTFTSTTCILNPCLMIMTAAIQKLSHHTMLHNLKFSLNVLTYFLVTLNSLSNSLLASQSVLSSLLNIPLLPPTFWRPTYMLMWYMPALLRNSTLATILVPSCKRNWSGR